MAVPRKPSMDVRPPTPASAALFDNDLLDLLDTATDVAFTVWLKLAEDAGLSSPLLEVLSHSRDDSQDSMAFSNIRRNHRSAIPAHQRDQLSTLLPHAENTTSSLKESLMSIRADPTAWTDTALPEHAQSFIRVVVDISQLVKIISSSHSFQSVVRQIFSRLTQITRECAILIQISSVRTNDLSGPQRPSGPGQAPPMSAQSTSPFYPGGNRFGNRSMEELEMPDSAAGNGKMRDFPASGGGLRGFQLASRQAERSRSRSNNPGSEDSSLRAPDVSAG